jgi:hypothetical protein
MLGTWSSNADCRSSDSSHNIRSDPRPLPVQTDQEPLREAAAQRAHQQLSGVIPAVPALDWPDRRVQRLDHLKSIAQLVIAASPVIDVNRVSTVPTHLLSISPHIS